VASVDAQAAQIAEQFRAAVHMGRPQRGGVHADDIVALLADHRPFAPLPVGSGEERGLALDRDLDPARHRVVAQQRAHQRVIVFARDAERGHRTSSKGPCQVSSPSG
jgi:hypothetical protein